MSRLFLRGFIHFNELNKCYFDYTPLKRTSGKSKYTTFKQIDFALTAIYLFARNFFNGILIFALTTNILFLLLLNLKFFAQNLYELSIFEYSVLLLGLISFFFSISLIYFLIKIYKRISTVPTIY